MRNLIILLLLALSLMSSGQNEDYEKSISFYEEQIEIYNNQTFNNIKDLVKSYTLYAQFLNTKGDYLNAELQLKKAQYSYNNYQLNYPPLKSYIHQAFAYNFLLQKDNKNAIDNYKAALKLLPETSLLHKGSIYRSLAELYYQSKLYSLSEDYFLISIDILSSNDSLYLNELAKTYQTYGYMLFEKGETKKGESNLNKAYKILSDAYGDQDNKTILVSNYLAYLYLNNQQLIKGIQFFQKSIIGVQKEFSDTNIYTNPKLENLKVNTELLYALKYKADALCQLHQHNKNKKALLAGIETFKLAVALVDKAKQSFLNEESLLAFSSSYKSSIINNAMLSCYQAYQLTQDLKYLELSFYFSEKGKASLLSNSLMDFKNKSLEGISDSLIQKEATLKNEISVIKSKAENEKNPKNVELLEIELFAKMDALDSVKLCIAEKLQGKIIDAVDFNPISIPKIQKQLQKDEIVIEYTLTGYSLYIYTISQDSFNLVKSRMDSAFYSNIKSLRKLITSTNFEQSYKDFKLFNNLAYQLYEQLIAPIEEQIQGKHLIIIPEEELLYVPFDILTDQRWKKGNTYRSLNYLIYDYPISYNYSSTLRFKFNKLKSNSKNEIITYAPDYNNKVDGLDPLPYAQEEVRYINKIFDTKSMLGQLATEHHFKTHAKDYQYIHLSMHASIDDENSLFTRLYFVEDSIDDGHLEINELYQLKLNSDLVVLSGCSTGDGGLYKGEGLYSLSRGFMQAGCPNITLTLWNINDESSYQIISNYYKNLADGFPNDIALQQSKIAYLKQASQLNSFPYFWASYIIVGDNNLTIEQGSNYYYLFMIVGFTIVVMLLLLFWRRKRG